MLNHDVLVIGGGHAGCEAAAASARMGARTALVSFSKSDIGMMSCNPAIGGLGKGHLVREVDAFDGLIGLAADEAAIHYRMLNASKGMAVRGPRVQADRKLYRAAIRRSLEGQPNLDMFEGEVASLVLRSDAVKGVQLADGMTLSSSAVVIATGTFLNAAMFRGSAKTTGGRWQEPSSLSLGQQLRALALPIGRLKTGTPPRLDGRTIDWARVARQASDGESWTMSPLTPGRRNPELSCGITRTNAATHDIIAAAMDRSPLRSGAIEGLGPRYCPSIEDKVSRFGDRDGHQIFLEPEGIDTHLIYPNGISTSLPHEIQIEFVRSIAGLEQVEIVTPGYAVEYDFLDPRSLDSTLELRAIAGLFLAGQINGTTGYEEAAAQGLVAGLNAAAHARGSKPTILNRSDSYIGVMIDDLTLQGVTEPYRMLTARAEYRLRLRADNAETRLTPTALSSGCVGADRTDRFHNRAAQRLEIEAILTTQARGAEVIRVDPGAGVEARTLKEWLRVPGVGSAQLLALSPALGEFDADLLDEVIEDARYAPYLERQDAEIRLLRSEANILLEQGFDYRSIPGLSVEMIERLQLAQPATFDAARRVRGMTPAALAILLVHARRRRAA